MARIFIVSRSKSLNDKKMLSVSTAHFWVAHYRYGWKNWINRMVERIRSFDWRILSVGTCTARFWVVKESDQSHSWKIRIDRRVKTISKKGPLIITILVEPMGILPDWTWPSVQSGLIDLHSHPIWFLWAIRICCGCNKLFEEYSSAHEAHTKFYWTST